MSLSYIYVPDVPQGSQQINSTQPPISGNFQDIYDLLAVNHVPFNTANTFGKHNIVTYYNQDIIPSTGSDEIAIFSQDTVNGQVLYYRYPNNGSVYALNSSNSTPTDATAGSGTVSIATGYNSTGYFYLNGGIKCLMQSFSVGSNPPSSQTQTFQWNISNSQTGAPITFTYPPFYLSVSTGYMAPSSNVPAKSGIVASTVISNTQFSVTITNGGQGNIYALAIGI